MKAMKPVDKILSEDTSFPKSKFNLEFTEINKEPPSVSKVYSCPN